MSQTSRPAVPDRVGPILALRSLDAETVRVAVMMAMREGTVVPMLDAGGGPAPMPRALSRAGFAFHIAEIDLPAGEADYAVDGERHRVRCDPAGDLALAYVSCNGREDGDLDQDMAHRNAMWARLADRHDAVPFALLLQGGDQIYADEAGRAHPLAQGWPGDLPGALDPARRAEVRAALERAFTERYLTLYAQPAFARLSARVPALAMWDDHDICDGWGSLPPEALDSDLGRILFDVARDAFMLFQLAAPAAPPAFCGDPQGRSFGWWLDLPGLRIAAPDLRSERRPDRVMGPEGWRLTEAMLDAPAPERVLVMSSVPALGPRLSVVETLVNATGMVEEYEDDLRDQWQSRAHRAEWQQFLSGLSALHATGAQTTVLSGEIHLATRATMDTPAGPLHQLVASGIAHPPPPPAFARSLGMLARFGEAPLEGQPITLHPLPGQNRIYADQRNWLELHRTGGRWTAVWELEEDGRTDPLEI